MCIKEYNKNMQGVDRLDQYLKRFSIHSRHSFRKWHKTLAMSFIDIARCNAYLTRKMACGPTKSRDPHRDFMIELVTQLLSGEWKQLAPDDSILCDDQPSSTLFSPLSLSRSAKKPEEIQLCKFKSSQEADTLVGKSWKARQCAICRFEGKKYPSIRTVFCLDHTISLCSKANQIQTPSQDYFCPNKDWSCWKKFHEFYLPKGLFNGNGRVRRSSDLYVRKLLTEKDSTYQDARRLSFLQMLHAPNTSIEPQVDPTDGEITTAFRNENTNVRL